MPQYRIHMLERRTLLLSGSGSTNLLSVTINDSFRSVYTLCSGNVVTYLAAKYSCIPKCRKLSRRTKRYRCLCNYACLQALVNKALTWQSSCVIANLKVHDVIKYMQKHRATVIISCASQFYLCDVISRSRNRLSSPLKARFTPC